MAIDMVLGVGNAVVLVGALLELRHLIAAIRKHFDGCAGLRSALVRAGKLDDATLVGMVVCAILAVAIGVTIYGELL